MSDKRTEPTEQQLREAHRNGVLLWKEIQDIEHIKSAVPDGCKCHLVWREERSKAGIYLIVIIGYAK